LKRFSKPIHRIFCEEGMIKQIPRILGPTLSKFGKFPSPIPSNLSDHELDEFLDKEMRRITVRANKTRSVKLVVANCGMELFQIIENVQTFVDEFDISMHKLGLRDKIGDISIKSTMGRSIKIHSKSLSRSRPQDFQYPPPTGDFGRSHRHGIQPMLIRTYSYAHPGKPKRQLPKKKAIHRRRTQRAEYKWKKIMARRRTKKDLPNH